MKFIAWWLRRVAGEDLARDIIGDALESRAGSWRLVVIAAGITLRRVRESIGASTGRGPVLGRGFQRCSVFDSFVAAIAVVRDDDGRGGRIKHGARDHGVRRR